MGTVINILLEPTVGDSREFPIRLSCRPSLAITFDFISGSRWIDCSRRSCPSSILRSFKVISSFTDVALVQAYHLLVKLMLTNISLRVSNHNDYIFGVNNFLGSLPPSRHGAHNWEGVGWWTDCNLHY